MLKHGSLFLLILVLVACSQNPEVQSPLPDSFPNEASSLASPKGQVIIDAVTEGRLSTNFRPAPMSLDSINETLESQACGPSTLRQGSRGTSVRYLQNRLLSFGDTPANHIHNSGGANGVFGSGTTTAVRAFQTHFWIGVDGIVGNQTWSCVGCSSLESNRVWTRHTHGINMSHFLADRTGCLPNNAD